MLRTKEMTESCATAVAAVMMNAVSVTSPEVEGLVIAEIPKPTPGPGEILIKAVACGINRADTLQRKGKTPPFVLGLPK